MVRRHAVAYVCLAALFLIAVAHCTRDAVDRIDAIRHGDEYVRDPFEVIGPDGISEAMNAVDDEWGEERLMNAVRANRTAPARALIDRLMTSADAFVSRAPQHDDMTLVVVRVT